MWSYWNTFTLCDYGGKTIVMNVFLKKYFDLTRQSFLGYTSGNLSQVIKIGLTYVPFSLLSLYNSLYFTDSRENLEGEY